jgi:hypothetical protein
MRTDLAKKIIRASIFTTILLVSSASMLGSTAQAQGRHWGGGIGRGFVYRPQRVFVGPRFNVFPRVYAYPRYYYPYGAYSYGYYGYTPRYDAGPYDVAESSGYHDGYDRGGEDARDGRRYDPNNSSHFRESISSAYRDGFRRGYDQGYRNGAG